MILNKRNTTVLIASLLSIIVQPSFADGYRNPPEGAAAIGAFGGHRAFADDANTTIHNSANLVDLEQPIVQINTTFGYGRTKFEGDKTENPYFAIPGFSIAAPLKEGKYAVGFASYVAFGRSVEWKTDSTIATTPMPLGPGSPNYPYSGSMTVMDFTPNVAMRLSDSVSVGIGADIYYGEVEQKQFVAPFTIAKLTADGTALGWNAAITWKMTDRQRLTATYRSPFTIKYRGDNKISGLINSTTPINGEIEYPSIAALAYGVEFTDTLRAELNVEWLEFSVYQNLLIYNRTTGTPIAPPSAQKLKDTWTFGVGGEWDFAEHWTARSGFMYLQNPTPDETYGTLGPDEDQGVISFGLGYENEKHLVDIGYAYGLFGGRSISGSSNSPDGNYDFNVHLLTLSYGYKF